MAAIPTIILKVLSSILMSLVSEQVVKELVLFAIRKLVKSSKNTWDDELLEIAEKKWEESESGK